MLSALEIVLGIDNLIFIAILSQHLPKTYAKKARYIGLGLAFIIRVIMLFSASWLMKMTEPVIIGLSVKDLLLIAGGLFLIVKSGKEIKSDIKGEHSDKRVNPAGSFRSAVLQIAFVDFIFSFDSIITAVGLTQNIPVIIAAVIVSMIVMLFASGKLADFLEKYSRIKMIGIGFIFLIGVFLITEGLGLHIQKEYLYFALVFTTLVEILNIQKEKVQKRQLESKH